MAPRTRKDTSKPESAEASTERAETRTDEQADETREADVEQPPGVQADGSVVEPTGDKGAPAAEAAEGDVEQDEHEASVEALGDSEHHVVDATPAQRSTWEPDRHVQENYAQLREERGWTWAQLADSLEDTDRQLAAWLRGQSESAAPQRAGRASQETR